MEGSNRTVAAVILDLLAKEGVKKAFGIPGVHNLGFWNALSKERPEIVSVRHEQSCVYAAMDYLEQPGSWQLPLQRLVQGLQIPWVHLVKLPSLAHIFY